MMDVTYAVIEEKYAHLTGSRVAYGIAVYKGEGQDREPSIIHSIHDITPDRKRLEALVADCNRLKLSSLHIYDVVEDFLSE